MLEAPSISLERDFARALDPILFASDCGLVPDAIQARLLMSTSRRVLVNCSRQWGKSSITALSALFSCLYSETPARVVLVSPSQPQSTELFKKITTFWSKLPGAPEAKQESLTRMELSNGSRVISLPGSEKSVRGYSATLVIIDEAARCSDETIAAAKPMLAAAQDGGRLVCLSTPAGRRGFFHREWTQGEGYERFMVKASECARITPEFLSEERKTLGPLYAQEYECAFLDNDDEIFDRNLVERCLVDFPVFAL
jgi:hypothetical protein